jgi:arylsulfatase A-like enzyme
LITISPGPARSAILTALLALVLSLSCFLSTSKQPQPQYVIVIIMDAVRPDHVSCYGYERNTTPAIDELASKGAVFDDAIAQAPWTLSSVATLLSSTFPSQHGASRIEGKNVPLQSTATTIGEILMSQGYKTCAMSTAQIFTPALGLSQGFAEAYVIGGTKNILEKVAAPQLTDAAVAWLRKNRKEKCFLVLHHYDPHSVYIAGEECLSRFDPGYEGPFRFRFGSLDILQMAKVGRISDAVDLTDEDVHHIKALYDCEILRTDRAIGRLVDSLEAWDCLEESMIFVTADHGEEFLEHGSIEHGQTVYEESIKVPLVLFCPSYVAGPLRVEDQVGLIDVTPTILNALSIERPQHFEGKSLMPLVSPDFGAFDESPRPCGIPAECLISEAVIHRSEKKALRWPPWKLIFDPFFGAAELYQITEDPNEITNLIETRSDIASDLTEVLLLMEPYYTGGWGVAWRGPRGNGTTRGRLTVDRGLIEATTHNFYPDVFPQSDSLVISSNRMEVFFSSGIGQSWRGVEVRMKSAARTRFDITWNGRRRFDVMIGHRQENVEFPVTLEPSRALVARQDLRDLFRNSDADCIIFWVGPGSQPTATEEKMDELRKKLKAIGYIE